MPKPDLNGAARRSASEERAKQIVKNNAKNVSISEAELLAR